LSGRPPRFVRFRITPPQANNAPRNSVRASRGSPSSHSPARITNRDDLGRRTGPSDREGRARADRARRRRATRTSPYTISAQKRNGPGPRAAPCAAPAPRSRHPHGQDHADRRPRSPRGKKQIGITGDHRPHRACPGPAGRASRASSGGICREYTAAIASSAGPDSLPRARGRTRQEGEDRASDPPSRRCARAATRRVTATTQIAQRLPGLQRALHAEASKTPQELEREDGDVKMEFLSNIAREMLPVAGTGAHMSSGKCRQPRSRWRQVRTSLTADKTRYPPERVQVGLNERGGSG